MCVNASSSLAEFGSVFAIYAGIRDGRLRD